MFVIQRIPDKLTSCCILMDKVLASSIPIVVVNRNYRSVDGELLEIGTTVSVDLGIKVREDATLKKRIISEVNAPNDMAGLELSFC